MINYLKRFIKWQFKFLFSYYGPALLTIIFGVVFVHYFPQGPIWPVGAFALLMVILVFRYLK
ncbi:hypothetical protein VI01_16805 [Pantoea sp. SM3]|nr:hypothetical protein VI01_16805 [Pantoea sp. SM3]